MKSDREEQERERERGEVRRGWRNTWRRYREPGAYFMRNSPRDRELTCVTRASFALMRKRCSVANQRVEMRDEADVIYDCV